MAGFPKVLLVFLCIFFLTGTLSWSQPRDGVADDSVEDMQSANTVAIKVIDFFSKHLSGVDGARCPMYPTCSQYSREAFQKHGTIIGWVMACDRLLRCGRDELTVSPKIVVYDTVRCHDSVAANDFWWSQ